MKIAGRTIEGPNRVTLVLPREGQEDIVIIAQAIIEMEAFDKYCKLPIPPIVTKAGGVVESNFADKGYVDQFNAYNVKKLAFIILRSLEPSEIEWETVDLENPSTWDGYVDEMKAAGFSDVEINRIGNVCMEANALDEAKLDAARASFLRGQSAQ
jgi:hypothetical protein